MMYKKGDTVRIRDDLIVGEEYGLCPVKMEYDMKECLGKTGIVTDVMPEELAVKVNDWWWSEVMVTPERVVTPLEAATRLSKYLWIRADDFLPNNGEDMLLICCSGKPMKNITYDHAYALAYYTSDEGWIVDEYPDWKPIVHYWMRIPKRPEEDV